MLERKRERLHWYPWLYEDWRGSEHVRLMTRSQRDMYRELLDHCWEHGSIPADPALIARLLGEPEGEVIASHWPAIAPCFRKVAGDPVRLHNAKMTALRGERERRWQQAKTRGISGRRKQLQTLSLVGVSRDCPGTNPGYSDTDTDTEADIRTELGGGDGLPGDLILSSHNKHPAAAAGSAPATLELMPDDSAARPPALSLPEGFAELWERYGHKLGRDEALAAYRKLGLNPRHPTYGRVLEWIDRYQATKSWKDGVRLRLSTALRKRRFEDEITSKPDWRVEFAKKKDW